MLSCSSLKMNPQCLWGMPVINRWFICQADKFVLWLLGSSLKKIRVKFLPKVSCFNIWGDNGEMRRDSRKHLKWGCHIKWQENSKKNGNVVNSLPFEFEVLAQIFYINNQSSTFFYINKKLSLYHKKMFQWSTGLLGILKSIIKGSIWLMRANKEKRFKVTF